MLNSKINAVVAQKELRQLYSIIGSLEEKFIDSITLEERNTFVKDLYRICGDILIDLETPLIDQYPSLLFCHDYDFSEIVEQVQLLQYDRETSEEIVIATGLSCSQGVELFNQYENTNVIRYIFWLEKIV